MSSKKTFGIIMTVLSVLGGFYAITTYSDDTSNYYSGYNYEPPLTSHEITVILIGFVSIICFIIGLVLLLNAFEETTENTPAVWLCSSCNTTNRIDFAHCTHCGTAKPQKVNEAVILPDWVCASCGTSNKSRVGTCQNCGVTKQWSEDQQKH